MTLITQEYKKQNEELHQVRKSYGANGHQNKSLVTRLVREYDCKDILDYGCGKADLDRSLNKWFKFYKVTNYDPAIPEYADLPPLSDLVVCTDVLEHIEPECLHDVLDHLKEVAKKIILISIATHPAKKNLPDGRNAHLIQEKIEWWMPKLRERFHVTKFWGNKDEFYAICTTT